MTTKVIRKDEARWQRIKKSVQESDKGGRKGQWSAIKAGIATRKYQDQMHKIGKQPYHTTRKPSARSNSFVKWLKEDWRTKSNKRSRDTGERFLPHKAIEALTNKEYNATSAKKRRDTKKGKQFSQQPAKIATKTAKFRKM